MTYFRHTTDMFRGPGRTAVRSSELVCAGIRGWSGRQLAAVRRPIESMSAVDPVAMSMIEEVLQHWFTWTRPGCVRGWRLATKSPDG